MPKRALLIGILYNGTSSQLTGCENDVDVMKDLLTNRYGFPEENIKILTESSGNLPNEENIRNEIAEIVNSGVVGDTLVICYSGHGSSVPDYDGAEPDGKREVLCPMGDPMEGSRWSRPVIPDNELMPVFENLADGVTLYAFFDCCHSGTMLDLEQERSLQASKGVDEDFGDIQSKRMDPTDDEKGEIDRLAEERAFDHATRQITPYEKMKGVSGGRRIYSFSGCQDSQTSADSSRGVGGKWNGAFTTALFRILSKTPSPTVGNLIDEMRVNLKTGGYSQIPHLSLCQDGSFRDVFMSETDAPDLDSEAGDSPPSLEAENREAQSVSANGGGPTSFEDWPALEYVTLEVTEEMLPLGTVFTEITASDQGFGGTGSSKVTLVLYDADGNVKQDAQVAICSHYFEHYHLKMKRGAVPWLKEVSAGDKFVLLLVSAPWPGWACKGAQGCIRVEPAPKLEPFTAKAENLSQAVVAAADAGSTDIEVDGWPAKIHSSLLLQHGAEGLTKVDIGCVCADQGFGGTGSSKVVVSLLSPSLDVKETKDIAALSHDFKTFKMEFAGEEFAAAEVGDSIAIVLVSAPWPGWAARCLQSRVLAHFNPLEGSKSMDDPPLTEPMVFERADETAVSAGDAGSTPIEVDGWPARACFRAPLVEGKSFPPRQVLVSCTARDQGFGGTGASKVVLVLYDADGEVKGHTQIGDCLTHDWEEYSGQFGLSNSCLSLAEAGDTLALAVVSAPWPGWAAHCNQARMELTCFGCAEMAKKIKQLFHEGDLDADGTLDEEEFMRIGSMIGIEEGEFVELIASIDKNADGRIDVDEFIDWIFEDGLI